MVDTSKLSVTLANDTQKIKIVMSGAALDTTHDKLVLDVDLDLGITLASVSNKTIAGVSGLSYAYDSSTKALTISKTNNAVLSAAEAQTIIAGILFKDTSASLTSGNRIATITLEDAATNVSTAAVSTLVVDTLVPTSLASSLVVSTQKGFKIVSVGDIMGSSNTHNLASGETATLTSLIPSGFTGSSFLTALRGMAVEWGGFSITANANTTDASYPTFKSFGSSGPTSGTAFDIFHQGGNFVKGENITFTGSASALTLTGNSQFYVANKDVYDYATNGGSKTNNSGYDIGNVKLLYQFDTGFQDTTPTIDVTYDGTKAQVGDVIQLFEGSTLLGSRVLTSSDVGSANTTRGVDVLNSLSFGNHNITTKFVDTAGATVTASNVAVNITSSGTPPTVTGLTVSADNGVTNVSLNDSLTSYAAVSSLNNYNVDKNLTFRGNVSADSVVSISMGGQQIAFASVTAGNFSIKAATNILKPGFYSDLSITVTDATSGASQGQTTLFTDYKMGWYYGSQALGDVTGGAGNDNFILGTSTASSRVQTGAGNDIVTVGGFGLTSGLSKIISDFTVGTDTVKVNGQTVTSANLSNFVTASASGSDTRLVIDLDGAGAGATTYTLTLTGVTFNSANTATIFGI